MGCYLRRQNWHRPVSPSPVTSVFQWVSTIWEHARHRVSQNGTWGKGSPAVCATLSSCNCALGAARECDAYSACHPSGDPIAGLDVASSFCNLVYTKLGCPCTSLKEIRIWLVSNSILNADFKHIRVVSRIGTRFSSQLSLSWQSETCHASFSTGYRHSRKSHPKHWPHRPERGHHL